jgi:glutathione peroxidase
MPNVSAALPPVFLGATQMKLFISLVALSVAAVATWALSANADNAPAPSTAPSTAPADVPAALNFKVKNIDGKDVDLATYKGKVLLVLNVASKCGNTPQYTALEAMAKKYRDQGLVVMGFPANNFGGQEPGTEAEIKEFCEETYKVDFPMFSKVSVKGDDIAPLFKYLTSQECKPVSKGDIAWNFEKFLINRQGTLINRFANKTKPDDPTIVTAVETALAEKN